jgi:exodeoxyribonuclease VII large subunit
VILAPTPVQGEDAPPRIVAALQSLGGVAGVEVILLARGGGSIEDLWAFNDERVVRAVAASEIPVIAGVGHETDFTLADFAADLRAPTPTAAAELATPDRLELAYSLAESDVRLNRAMELVLQGREASLLVLEGRLQRATPLQRILSDRQRIDELGGRAAGALAARLAVLRARLGGLEQSLQSLNPQAILARGFSMVTRADGKVVRRTVDVRTGDEIRIRVSDGEFEATVD